MKYIRTEDGIYEDAGTDALGLRCVRYNGNKIALSQDDDKIVKESDTIEELCDEFVYFIENCGKKMTLVDHFLSYNGFGYNKVYAIYGAIWTNKGLIYVAKMNEKGELELI